MTGNEAGRVEVTYHPGDPRSSELRVRTGSEIAITLHGSPGYGWTPIEGVGGPLTRVEASWSGGTVRARLRAVGPGEAELRSTSSFRGDRFGPQTQVWRLLVRVDP